MLVAANVVAAVIFLAYMGRRIVADVQAILALGLEINLGRLLLAGLLYGANFFLFLVVWRNIVTRLGANPNWRQNAAIYGYTHVAQFLPTPAWMLLGRLHFYGKAGIGRRRTLTMTAVEVILHALAGVSLLALVTFDPRRPLTWLALLLLAPVVALLVRPRLLELRWVNGAVAVPGIRRADVAAWLGLYFVSWLVAGPFMALIVGAYASPGPIPLLDLYRVWILSGLVAYASAYTLGGAGFLREFTMSWLLSSWFGPAMALVIALTLRLVMLVSGVVWGLSVVTVLGGIPSELAQAQPNQPELEEVK
jgi:hypothetical protein